MGPSVEFQLLVRWRGAGFSLWQNFFRAVPIRNSNKYWEDKMQEIQSDIKFLSKKFNVSERYARDIFLEARMKNGVYDFLKCIDLYVIYRDKQVEEFNAKRDKLTEVRAEIAQFKLEILKKDYHRTEDIELFLGELTSRIKSKVLSIPNKGARLVTGETEITKVEAVLKDFTDDILRDLSDYENFEILEEVDAGEDQETI